MTDEQNNHGQQPEGNSVPDSPAVRPVYSTNDYSGRRTSPPPPPPMRSSATRERVHRRRRSNQNSAGEWVWVVVAGALFAVVIVISIGAVIFVQASQDSLEIIPTADVSALLPTPVVVYNDFGDVIIDDRLIMPDGSAIELVPWDGESRFTMVLVGLDRRPGDTGLMYRTDTMMLISIDPQSSSIGVLSIPRDLYVQIPGYSQLQRINTGMFLGEVQRTGYGPTLMMQTVQLNLGIRVHDYMAVDFQAFIDVVEAIGGVDIQTDYTINDQQYPDMNYGYDPFYLAAGNHHLNGYDALRFARTRHGSSDIQRAERQQQVMYAIRDRIMNFDMLPALVAQSPMLWNSWDDNVYTGLSFEQLLQLGLYIKDIPRDNIKMGTIDYRYLQDYQLPDGAQVLIPNRYRLGGLMVEVFGDNYAQ